MLSLLFSKLFVVYSWSNLGGGNHNLLFNVLCKETFVIDIGCLFIIHKAYLMNIVARINASKISSQVVLYGWRQEEFNFIFTSRIVVKYDLNLALLNCHKLQWHQLINAR
jgi:hypothetical protein